MGFWGGYDLIFFFCYKVCSAMGYGFGGFFWILFVSSTVAGVMNLGFFFFFFYLIVAMLKVCA
jgi:hypothetical protein